MLGHRGRRWPNMDPTLDTNIKYSSSLVIRLALAEFERCTSHTARDRYQPPSKTPPPELKGSISIIISKPHTIHAAFDPKSSS